MRKRIITSILLFFLGAIALIRFGISLKKDLNINLVKADQVVGVVGRARTIEIQRATLKYRSKKTVFNFQLQNCDQDFAIDRYGEGYIDLQTNIKIGDTLKVYYYAKQSDLNTRVYQVEKNATILESYKQYEKRESKMAGWCLLLGLVLTVAAFFQYFKLNPIKLLTSLVDKK